MLHCPECNEKVSDNDFGRFTCSQCKTVVISTVDNGIRVIEPPRMERVRNTDHSTRIVRVVGPTQSICVGCLKDVPKAFTQTGKYFKTVSWTVKRKTELVYNPVSGLTTQETIEKRIPVNHYAHGYLCDDCASDYRMIPFPKRDGSIEWKPKVIPDESHTLHSTLIPERESFRGMVERVEKPSDGIALEYEVCVGSTRHDIKLIKSNGR